MVKFSKELNAIITPEWRKQYIQYDKFKATLMKHMLEAPDPQFVDPEAVIIYHTKFKEVWFHDMEEEHKKILAFYRDRITEANTRFVSLKDELNKAHASSENRKHNDKMLKTAYSEFYLSLNMTENYVKYNLLGFKKILKKFDKNINCTDGAEWQKDFLSQSELKSAKDIEKIILQVETLFAEELEDGDRKKAMQRLRIPAVGFQNTKTLSIKVGFLSGCAAILLLLVIGTIAMINVTRFVPSEEEMEQLYHSNDTDNGTRFYYRTDWNIVVRLYRGPLIVIFIIGLLSCNIHWWTKSGVNHVLIFELDPRSHSSDLQVMELFSSLLIVWCVSLLMFLFADWIGIPAFVSPLTMMTFFAVFFFNPTRTFKYQQRRWMIGVFLRILMTPLSYVTFADFWVADQFNSIQPVFPDLYYWYCYFTNIGRSPIANTWYLGTDDSVCREPSFWILFLGLLPAYFRLVHCLRRFRDTRHAFPHLANAGKYTASIVTNILGFSAKAAANHELVSQVLYGFYIFSKSIASIYALIWDLKMDWGLFDSNPGDNKLLRSELVYNSRTFYYFAILEDILMRSLWVFGLIIKQFTSIPRELITTVLNLAEVVRRFIWNFFRLENEHLNNCGQFRVIRNIAIAPVDMTDIEELFTMMDNKNGAAIVRQRRKQLGKA